MNTKVKVGIAGAIVAALIALIVLDQNTAPETGTPVGPDGPDPRITASPATAPAPTSEPPAIIIRRHDDASTGEEETYREAVRIFSGGSTPAPAESSPDPAPIKGTENSDPIYIPPAEDPIIIPEVTPTIPLVNGKPAKEYIIQEGDTYEEIASKHYGSRRHWSMIAEANPQMPPERLRVGKKIQIPAEPTSATAATNPNFDPDSINTDRYYTVRPGDTLSGISVKVFNTSRHMQKIFDANREVIEDPNLLVVGTKLYMPDLVVRKPSSNTVNRSGAGTAETSAPPGSKVHQVQPNESLWKIAEKYAGGRGILQTIQDIVVANGDKLESDASLLRVGWNLIIPE